ASSRAPAAWPAAPTRRSSDLGALALQSVEDRVAVERREVDVQQQQRVRSLHVEGEELAQRFAPVAVGGEAVAVGAQPVLEQPGEDRKSTRLNSIAYAVFCLQQ